MTFDWARTLSSELIEAYGSPITLSILGDPEFSKPSRGGSSDIISISTFGLFLRPTVNRGRTNNTTFELVSDATFGEVQVYVSAKRKPTQDDSTTTVPEIRPGDTITTEKGTYGIQSVETISPDLTNIIYVLGVTF